jgi:hypothetical protein
MCNATKNLQSFFNTVQSIIQRSCSSLASSFCLYTIIRMQHNKWMSSGTRSGDLGAKSVDIHNQSTNQETDGYDPELLC